MYITYMGNKLNNKKGENMTIKLVRIKNETFTDDPDRRLYVYGQYTIRNDCDYYGWKVFDGDKQINTKGYCFKASKDFLKNYINQNSQEVA